MAALGVASSHDYRYLPNRVNRGWKPLPQSVSLNLTSLGFFSWFQRAFLMIKRAPLAAGFNIEPQNFEGWDRCALSF